MIPSHSPVTRAAILTLARLSLLLASALVAGGCSHKDPTAITSAGSASDLFARGPDLGDLEHGRLLVPLAIGNRWDYRSRFQGTIVTDSGTQPGFDVVTPLRDEIIGTERIGEHEYFLIQESNPASGETYGVFRDREDRSGLFEHDPPSQPAGSLAVVEAPGSVRQLSDYLARTVADEAQRAAFQRAAAVLATRLAALRHVAGGPEPGEIAFLRFPLFVRASWIVRESPRFERTVTARERVELPAGEFTAWSIRGTPELYGPEDRLQLWYSAEGLLRLQFHGVAEATDPFGNVIGLLVADLDQSLTALHLEGGTPGAAPVAGGGKQE
jgi:hypothetical protein